MSLESSSSSFSVLNSTTWALFGAIDDACLIEAYKAITCADPHKNILFLLDSEGGDQTGTFGLIYHLRHKFERLEIRVTAHAMSAAIDLLLAGTLRTSVPTACFFTHAAADDKVVRPYNVAQHAEWFVSHQDWMLRLYAERTNKNLRFWRSFFDKDRFFDADEALNLGLIDQIL